MINSAQLESQKQLLLSRFDGWSVARLSYRPSASGWSAIQVLDHLVRTEEEILSSAKQGLGFPHRIGVRDRIGFLFIRKIFETDRKVKVPASAAQVLPDQYPAFGDVLERWQITRSDFVRFQSQLSPKQAVSGLFRHPVCGWMGMPQISQFFFVHMIHHGFQIGRLEVLTELERFKQE